MTPLVLAFFTLKFVLERSLIMLAALAVAFSLTLPHIFARANEDHSFNAALFQGYDVYFRKRSFAVSRATLFTSCSLLCGFEFHGPSLGTTPLTLLHAYFVRSTRYID